MKWGGGGKSLRLKKKARYDKDWDFFSLSRFKLIATLASIEGATYECVIKV